ncbi:hypothetical protein CLU79DRAFT_726386 [Phycomyces nitens]|nr:hypothetical protein CLU79DRAFT_726386 [Phycomyces nitens]
MGNSQSIGRVVEEGVQIYQAVKQQQEQEQHKQQQQQHQQQYQQHNSFNGFQPSPSPHNQHDSGDDDYEYTRLRECAHQEAEKRNDCYGRSKAAYQSGDGALAKQLSNQGHQHDNAMNRYNSQAADLIFKLKNQGRSPTEIDLHGLFVKEASAKVEEAIKRCEREKYDHLVIIVGKGLHSTGNIAKLKPAILDLVKRYNVHVEPNKPNPGCLYVEFGKGTGDMSWLDRLSDKMASKECTIM